MNGKLPLVPGALVLGVVGIGYIGWRFRFQKWTDAIERGDQEGMEALADELFEAGQLGRDVRVLTGLLAICLAGMLLVARLETSDITKAAPNSFGYGSYL